MRGSGSIGGVLFDQEYREIERFSEVVGYTTCNEAEYHALARGLDLAAKHTRLRVECFIDSDIVEGQLGGRYRLKNSGLRQMFHKVKDLERPFKSVTYCRVSRNEQHLKIAHELAHNLINGRLSSSLKSA